MCMLVAITNNKYFSITDNYSREQLIKLRKQQKFLCPQCKSNVQLKVGKVKTPHFAHLPEERCRNLFSEGESETHLLGKIALYNFFKKAGKNVVLEPYITFLSQRPDLLIHDQNETYAIEFQCSTIDSDLLMKRNSGYVQNGMRPFWVLNTPLKYVQETDRITIVSLTKFEQQFIVNDDYDYLLTFHPKTNTFYYFAHLLHLQNNQFITKIKRLPIHHQMFPFIKPKKVAFPQFLSMLKLYKKKTQTYVENKIYTSQKGVNDILLRSIYELKLNRFNMPLFLGIPTKHAMSMKMAAVEWQTALFYYCQLHSKDISQLSKYDIEQFIAWLKLERSDEKIIAISSYVEFLKGLDIDGIKEGKHEIQVFEKLYTI